MKELYVLVSKRPYNNGWS